MFFVANADNERLLRSLSAQAQTPGIDGTTPAFVLFWADLNGTHHIRHVANVSHAADAQLAGACGQHAGRRIG